MADAQARRRELGVPPAETGCKKLSGEGSWQISLTNPKHMQKTPKNNHFSEDLKVNVKRIGRVFKALGLRTQLYKVHHFTDNLRPRIPLSMLPVLLGANAANSMCSMQRLRGAASPKEGPHFESIKSHIAMGIHGDGVSTSVQTFRHIATIHSILQPCSILSRPGKRNWRHGTSSK